MAKVEFKNADKITISYTTKKFELPQIYNIYVPKIIESADLNISSKVEGIYSQIDMLTSNMNTIDENTKLIKDGSQKLKDSLINAIESMKNDNSDALTQEQVDSIKEEVKQNVQDRFTDEYKEAIGKNAITEIKESEGYKQIQNNINTLKDEGIEQVVNICESDSSKPVCEENALNIINYKSLIQTQNIMEQTAYNVAINATMQSAIVTSSEIAENVSLKVANSVKKGVINKISESLIELYLGIDTLDNSLDKLSNGISQFNTEGIQKAGDLVNVKLKGTEQKIEALLTLSDNYNSFGGKKNNDNGETKFICVIDSQKVPEKINKYNDNKQNISLWQKIKNLFS